MSKRKLSKQQRTRLRDRQTHYNETDDKAARAGRVLCFYGKEADVQCDVSQASVRCRIRPSIESIATGDYVSWLDDEANIEEANGVIVAVKERSSTLVRPDGYGKLKIVAANVDQVVITLAVEPEPHANLIDRYLVTAHKNDLAVLLLLNKSDLIAHRPQGEALLALLKRYEKLGYETLQISAKTENDIKKLHPYLSKGTSVFAGQSGVGKSSLIQSLLPNKNIKTGKLSEAAQKGRHTTTLAQLYQFPDGGNCIDSPGIREFGLWHLSREDVIAGFKELQPYEGQCRFRNCMHDKEPDCAIRSAIESDVLTEERAKSFYHILSSLDDVSMRPYF